MTSGFMKGRALWVSTLGFLLIAGAIGYFLFPPLLKTYQVQHKKMVDLNDQIASQTQYIATIKSLTAHPETVDSLYGRANELLPVTVQSDLLALQLDGLIANLKLTGLTVTVPFVTSGTTAPSVTITGPANFTQAQQLIAGLKSLSRWNKISSIDLTQSSDQASVTVTTSVFFRSTALPEFTGSNTKLLVQATQLFKNFQSYTTTPDVTIEGQYGRPDPFAAPK